jgi:DNA-3-methyladenine glycosylase II
MMNVWTETIKVQAPYHFDLVLDRLRLDPLQNIDHKTRTVKVPLYIEGSPLVLTVQALGEINDPSFKVTGIDPGKQSKALERLKKIFYWHLPLSDSPPKLVSKS